MTQVNTDKLRQDLRAVVVDTEELLKATAEQTGEHIERIRARAQQTLRDARVQLQDAGQTAAAAAKLATEKVDGTVREHPWTAIGIAAGVGVLLGLLFRRR